MDDPQKQTQKQDQDAYQKGYQDGLSDAKKCENNKNDSSFSQQARPGEQKGIPGSQVPGKNPSLPSEQDKK